MFHIYVWPEGSFMSNNDFMSAVTRKCLMDGMYYVILSSLERLTPAQVELQVQIFLYG